VGSGEPCRGPWGPLPELVRAPSRTRGTCPRSAPSRGSRGRRAHRAADLGPGLRGPWPPPHPPSARSTPRSSLRSAKRAATRAGECASPSVDRGPEDREVDLLYFGARFGFLTPLPFALPPGPARGRGHQASAAHRRWRGARDRGREALLDPLRGPNEAPMSAAEGRFPGDRGEDPLLLHGDDHGGRRWGSNWG
jgi:hypothetical protein